MTTKLVLAKIPNGEIVDNVIYTDFGNTKAPNGEFYTSTFKFANMELRNDFYPIGYAEESLAEQRFNHDIDFLRKHNFHLKQVNLE